MAHTPIKGYRELSASELESINGIKDVAEVVRRHVDAVNGLADVDQRWVAIARTDLQKGFMALIRAIARSTTF